MEEKKKVAPAVTEATGKTISFSVVRCIQMQCRDEGLVGTGVIRLHPTLESALRESQTRIQDL